MPSYFSLKNPILDFIKEQKNKLTTIIIIIKIRENLIITII